MSKNSRLDKDKLTVISSLVAMFITKVTVACTRGSDGYVNIRHTGNSRAYANILSFFLPKLYIYIYFPCINNMYRVCIFVDIV